MRALPSEDHFCPDVWQQQRSKTDFSKLCLYINVASQVIGLPHPPRELGRKKKTKTKIRKRWKWRTILEVGEEQTVLFFKLEVSGTCVRGATMGSPALLHPQVYPGDTTAHPRKSREIIWTHQRAGYSWGTCWASISLLGFKKKWYL